MKKYLLAFKVLRQLGLRQGFLYLYYQILLRSGLFRFLSPINASSVIAPISPFPLNLEPTELKDILHGYENLLKEEATQIVEGQITLFGELKQVLDFSQPEELRHWSHHRAVWFNGKDIKLFWESGRFGWATILARAYFLSKDEKYAKTFWRYTEEFLEKNPINRGLHWASAQEVALRLINLSFCFSVFAESEYSNKARQKMLSNSIAAHAMRIPPTLIYARAQNNNHLLTEALGLYTAAAFLPEHPQAKKWRSLGWKWLNRAFKRQIKSDGSYIQNSNNYHRLMLQTALWAKKIAAIHGDTLPPKTTKALTAATKHLYASLDETSGQVPNLGPNDGAYILPLSILPFNDYRPVLQAAGKVFLGQSLFSKGLWDEMGAWLVNEVTPEKRNFAEVKINRLDRINSWASIRATKHRSRPGHADQLHVELWWRGLNVAQDAGTYLYNAPNPWQNALSNTDVHNTISLNGRGQMLKASRFLYLDWAQAKVIKKTDHQITAEHIGYRKLGLKHQRSLELLGEDKWQISDLITNKKNEPFTARLHWLLPDWPWKIKNNTLELDSPHGLVRLQITSDTQMALSLARAGELLYGEGDIPQHRGWASPTYAVKHPALSFAVSFKAKTQLNLSSTWTFPK